MTKACEGIDVIKVFCNFIFCSLSRANSYFFSPSLVTAFMGAHISQVGLELSRPVLHLE